MKGHGLLLILVASLAGCSAAPHRTASSPASTVESRALVFAVDGAGNFQGSSLALKEFIANENLPVHVHTFEWSHGYRRIFADHLDSAHARTEGKKLADEILCYQRQAPESALPVCIIAHSAGSLVALTAAEYLPPDSIERIILLAPSVSTNYDVRPALRCCRQGMDVFHSRLDRGYLGVAVALFGTSDGTRAPVSGRVGFRVPDNTGTDSGLYARLHQHPWEESVGWTGHSGGHFSVYQAGYLKAYVVPLMMPDAPRGQGPTAK